MALTGCASSSKAAPYFEEVCETWFSSQAFISYEATTESFKSEINAAKKVDLSGSKEFVAQIALMESIVNRESTEMDERTRRLVNQDKQNVDENFNRICKPYCADCFLPLR